jgi:hypothetical protein
VTDASGIVCRLNPPPKEVCIKRPLSRAAVHYAFQHHLLFASISYACLNLHISQVTIPPSFFVIIHGKESYMERESARKSKPVVSNNPQSERGVKLNDLFTAADSGMGHYTRCTQRRRSSGQHLFYEPLFLTSGCPMITAIVL